ncbi:translocation and assembly module lipoprotein TamL [Chitinophaga japonensis]|uniref:Outer membrane protein assembly factor BamA n=1 Tax=Chitinophaga japonensis TaxID=104662 RepID=A0A562T3N8_CHIJA|nr:BamA/TamA family outer membrane protein [Chitinophaga japonensis]TWI88167.1 outer membrane protein assembly factor BamA [Chitinophaga japonensis]
MQPPHSSHSSFLNYTVLLITLLVLAACSNTKYLQQDQTLYTSASVNVKGEGLAAADKQDLRSSLSSKSLMLQQPNSKFMGTRIKVWLYNQKYNEQKSNWFWNLMLAPRNLEAPVLYDSTKTKASIDRMVSYLNNQGYFYATAAYDEKIRHQKASVTYQVNTGKNFLVDQIYYDVQDSAILGLVKNAEPFSLIKKNMPYKQEVLASERERLFRLVKNAGYYKFSRDAIEFELDTLHKALFRNPLNPFEGITNIFSERKAQEKPTMDITVRIRNPEDTLASWEPYRIDSIYVYPDFPINGNPNDTSFKTDVQPHIVIRSRQDILKPRVLSRSVLLRSGDLYSLQRDNNTINRLYDLGPWQIVTLEYKERKDTSGKLNAYLYMRPKRRQELGANFEVSTSSDYLVGTGVSLNYRHLNLNRAANQLSISLNTGLEMIRNQQNSFVVQAKQFGGRVDLTFPRFITPFPIRTGNRSTIRTRLSAGFDYLSRIDRFKINNINASFGYEWNESIYKRWIVKPISLNYVGVSLNPDFRDTVVNPNPYLRRSFEPAFIGGENVTFIFSNNDALHKRHNSYFRANIEESGLWLNGINSIMNWVSNRQSNLESMTGLTISNFIKLEADYRHYWNLNLHSSLATRIYAGVGIPYSKSQVLPYIRQFTAGGPLSIRAWRLRTLGPGSYKDSSAIAQIFPDQTGDMKLEGNIEYRFDLLRMFNGTVNLKGATFLDIGNIWMLSRDTLRPGGEFHLNKLYHDLAIGTGAGLRLDFNFFLVRLDWGIPLKVPYFTEQKNGWYFSEWDLADKQWRRDNIIWNIAIGYPF